MDIETLKAVLPLLAECGVKRFVCSEFELEIDHAAKPGQSTEAISTALKQADDSLPPDLRADDLMNADKVLNWSASPDSHDAEMPLTGDAPLGDA